MRGRGVTDDLTQGLEHSRLLRQRRQTPETEDDLLALQDEFYKGTDRTAATAVRVTRPPAIGTASQVTSSSTQPSTSTSTSTKTTEDDDDDEGDIPPPLEKDVVSLGDTELPARPPTIQHAPPSSKLRPGSRFLQDRANKGPRTHFPGGERFEIDLDEDEHEHEHGHEIPVETEEETRKRLNAVGASMGQILHEVLEKPVAEAVAPTGPTTALGSLAPAPGATKAGKGKSLFAQRLAQAQGKAPSNPASSSGGNSDIPSSAAYVSLTSRSAKDVVTIPDAHEAQPVIPTRASKTPSHASHSRDGSLPPKPSAPLHSVLKKTSDTPQSVLKEQIDDENRQKIANMTEQEIEESRAELMRNLDPELIKKLLSRRTIPRRVSFSEGIKVEDKVVSIQEAKIGREHSSFQAKRHEEEEGDHPLAMKKKFYPDLPAEPEKLEWMGIEGASEGAKAPGKSIAPGPQPYTVQEADPAAAHFRFDFAGRIINEEDTPVHLGLHHHGADPTKAGYTLSELLHLIRSTVPSQRIIPLNVVAKVLNNCRDPAYASFETRSGILRWLIDSLRAPVYLRAALDDKTDSGLVAAINAIHSWSVPQANSNNQEIWESLDLLNRGYERINLGFKFQTITKFANMELKPDTLQASQEQGTESEETIASHAILASKDPVDGLLAMNVVPRLRYILDVCQLPAHTNNQALDILLTLVRRNPGGAKKVFECEGLLSALIRQYVTIPWPSEKSDLELSCTAKVVALLDLVVRSSKKYASAIIEEALLDSLLRFVVVTPEPVAENKESFLVQIQVLKLYRSLSAYGLYCDVLGDMVHAFLLKDIAQACLDRSKPDLDPIVKSFLSRKLAMCLQLATTWTHAAADPHRTIPEHALCWAQALAFMDLALDGITQWRKFEQEEAFNNDHVILVSSAVRYISTWARYLSTNPPEDASILDRVWEALQFREWTKSKEFKSVHTRLSIALGQVPELSEIPLPHLGISLSNPSQLGEASSTLFEGSLYSEYLSSHLTTMYYLARLVNAPAYILEETVNTLVSSSIFGLVEIVTKYELTIQDLIPATLPPWMAFICRHGVYFVAHWLSAMDVLVYQQHPESSSHIKLTFFPLFQVTALSLLQIILPGDESLSHDVLLKILFNPRVLDKLLSHNISQIKVVKRILEPLYHQLFIKSEVHLTQSQSLLSHDGRGIRSLVVDYGSITGQPLFNWLFYPIEIMYKSKLTYVEESGALIAATSVAHCTLDFVYSLLQTLDGISFELIYMASLKVLALEGEKEPGRIQEEDDDEPIDGAAQDERDEEEAEEEDDGFMDQEVEATINRLLDHFSTRGDCSLVRDDSQGLAPLSEKTLSLLTAPLPFYQFLKNYLENSFTTGALLQYQATAARFLFPAMAISQEFKLLIWAESFNFLGSVTTKWEELDSGTLKSLIHDDQAVSSEVLKHYLKAVVSGRVIKQRNPVLYWIAVHHLARVSFAPLKINLSARGMPHRPVLSKAPKTDEQAPEESDLQAEERQAIVRSIVGGTKSEELVRDWAQYDSRNYDRSASTLLTSLVTTGLGSGSAPGGAMSSSASLPSFDSNRTSPVSASSPIVKSPSRPLSLLSTSSSFPTIGSSEYLNSDNILTPPECFRERRQLIVAARKEWIRGIVGEKGLERVEKAILAAAPHSMGSPGLGGPMSAR
ncbi:RNA polymerase II associated protein 1 [Mortierella antarctica]|nr:RNA polymerase II associated protein 1 [Mortierella antarctica]